MIALVMTIWGMTAALIAGVIAALSTYAVQVSWNLGTYSTKILIHRLTHCLCLQSINHQDPIRQILSATTLRSSDWNRCATARAILENDVTGRSRILVFQLQGHVSSDMFCFCR